MTEPFISFDNALSKIKRAKRHISELTSHLTEIQNGRSHSITMDQNPIDGTYEFKVSTILITEEIPHCIGDAAHNARAALDYVWMGLHRAIGSTDKKTFPMAETREGLVGTINRAAIQKPFPYVTNLISGNADIYTVGDGAIWTINAIDNFDKHNMLVPAFQITEIRDVYFGDERGNQVFGGNIRISGNRTTRTWTQLTAAKFARRQAERKRRTSHRACRSGWRCV